MELALSAQELDERRLITGTKGPGYTHIPLGAEAGLTEYAESYANATDLHTIPKPGSTATGAAWPAPSWPACNKPSAPTWGYDLPAQAAVADSSGHTTKGRASLSARPSLMAESKHS